MASVYDRQWQGYRVFVGALSAETEKADIISGLGYYGLIRHVWLARSPPGYGYVVYHRARDADACVRYQNNRFLAGRRVKVEHAQPLCRSPSRRGPSNQRTTRDHKKKRSKSGHNKQSSSKRSSDEENCLRGRSPCTYSKNGKHLKRTGGDKPADQHNSRQRRCIRKQSGDSSSSSSSETSK